MKKITDLIINFYSVYNDREEEDEFQLSLYGSGVHGQLDEFYFVSEFFDTEEEAEEKAELWQADLESQFGLTLAIENNC